MINSSNGSSSNEDLPLIFVNILRRLSFRQASKYLDILPRQPESTAQIVGIRGFLQEQVAWERDRGTQITT